MADQAPQPEPDRFETLARAWLQSVHAVWEPRMENRHNDPSGTRFIFIDGESRRHSLVHNSEGFVVQYSGPRGMTPTGAVGRLRLLFKDRGGNRFRLMVKPNGTIEVFRPL